MDINAITALIGSVGFPIVMCLLMLKFMKESEDSHKEEINSLKDSYNKNTQVLTELKTMFNDFIKTKQEDSGNA